MIGTIAVEELEVECIVGILPAERVETQTIFFDVEIDRDFEAARKSEHVDDTVDYVDLARALTDLAVKRRYQLLETMAEDAADLLIERFGALRAKVKIMKPGAIPAANFAAVTVERRAGS